MKKLNGSYMILDMMQVSSEETIAFYRAMGSFLAENPIEEMAEEEPFDLQMVCSVNTL